MRFILSILLLAYTLCAFSQNEDLYNLTNSSAFAERLYITQQYDLAAIEYERVLFLTPDNEGTQSKLLSSYTKSGNNTFGIQRAELLYHNRTTMPAKIAFQYSAMLLKEHWFTKADSFLNDAQYLDPNQKLILQATSFGLAGNYKKATLYINQVKPEYQSYVAQYKSILVNADALKFKKPYLAAGMSALIPGSGKFYTRDWKDGIVSVLMIVTTSLQASRAFNRSGSDSIRGWLFGSVAVGFYIGNIYGSHKAARLHNKHLTQQIQHSIESLFTTSF